MGKCLELGRLCLGQPGEVIGCSRKGRGIHRLMLWTTFQWDCMHLPSVVKDQEKRCVKEPQYNYLKPRWDGLILLFVFFSTLEEEKKHCVKIITLGNQGLASDSVVRGKGEMELNSSPSSKQYPNLPPLALESAADQGRAPGFLKWKLRLHSNSYHGRLDRGLLPIQIHFSFALFLLLFAIICNSLVIM